MRLPCARRHNKSAIFFTLYIPWTILPWAQAELQADIEYKFVLESNSAPEETLQRPRDAIGGAGLRAQGNRLFVAHPENELVKTRSDSNIWRYPDIAPLSLRFASDDSTHEVDHRGVTGKDYERTAQASEDAQEGSKPESAADLFGLEEEEEPKERRAWEITGYYQNELAYTHPEPDHFSKFRNTLQIGSQGRLSDRVRWTATGRIVYDPIYDLDDFYPPDVEDDQEIEAQIRDTYVDIAGDWEFRLGRQHIVWGEVLGFFIADVVSARDFRDFRGIDLEQLRIPQWAARGEYFQGDLHLEVVWIPYTSYDDIGEFGAEFYPLQLPPPSGFDLRVLDEDTPHGFSESGYGFRLSYLLKGWDGSLFYYSSMDRSPAFERRIAADSPSTLLVRPIHERIHQLGGTLTKDVGVAVFKAEAVYTRDRLFSVRDLSDPDGLAEKDSVDYVLSLDFAFAQETRLNLQFVQQWIPDHVSSLAQDNTEGNVSLFLSTRAPHPRVEPQLFFVRNVDRNEWLLRAQILWEINQNWYVNAGVDVFEGPNGGTLNDPKTGLIGQFDAKDRVFYELRYTF